MSILLGVIADDFTGATDIANTLVGQGMRVIQVIGVPAPDLAYGDAQAVVVALKSRSCAPEQAVDWSLSALEWLRAAGAQQIIFKYCSTFDSSARGNIGPVADALSHALASGCTIVCPAFPQNNRSVYQGYLFVGDQLLSESPMRDHPVTPMRDASLVRLMQAQSSRKVGLIPRAQVAQGPGTIAKALTKLAVRGFGYAVVDALDDDDMRAIGLAAREQPLITGSSAIALALPDNFRNAGRLTVAETPRSPSLSGRDLVLAGSCSGATRAQVDHVKNRWPCYRLDVDRLAATEAAIDTVVTWAQQQNPTTPILIYAAADPDEVALVQARYGVEYSGALVENALSRIALRLLDRGFDRIVVAGGETSGAVVTGLRIKALHIGPEIVPGVPWTEAWHGETRVALALKSGNFGGEDFFVNAFEALA